MNLKYLMVILLSTMSIVAQAQHQRLIVTHPLAPFSFDPLSRGYIARAAPQLATLVNAWRVELGADNVIVARIGNRGAGSNFGYDVYNALSDSTLLDRVEQWLALRPLTRELQAKFEVEQTMLDTLPQGRVLIVDRYQVSTQSATKSRTQSLGEMRASEHYIADFVDDELKVRQYFANPIARIDTSITTRDSYFGPSAFARLFHAFQLEVSAAQISLFAPVALDATIRSGSITIAQVVSLFRYDNSLVRATMTGGQLDSLLEKIYGMRYFAIRGEESDMVRLRVPHYLHDDAAGIRYRVDLAARNGHRVTIFQTESGVRFDPRAQYRVALNSFRAKELANVQIDTIAADYRIALIRWLTKHENHSPRAGDNWSIGPEKWSSAIEKRERVTIFENK